MSDFIQRHQNQEIGKERLQQLKDYEFYKLTDTFDKNVLTDFRFLLGFCPDFIQDKVIKDRNEVGLNHLVGYAIARLEELAGTSPMGTTIEMSKTGDDEFSADFSKQASYKILLEKFREFAKIYRFEE